MDSKKFCDIIVELRKRNGLTQEQLATKLNITDKAVSKWERGLSYPDITSISSLAKVLGVDSSYLIDLCKKEDSLNPYQKKEQIRKLISIIGEGIGLAMGIVIVVLNLITEIQVKDSISMLGIGLFSISLSILTKEKP
jgi:transcriptional regulator with XRE-family HTH domain